MQQIQLRGVRVHNLKNIDVDIPVGKLTVITGVSGSGKSSLAFDTLYAEGQRRYIESFSTYARRFLDRLDKPDADRIDNIPPAVAMRQNEASRRQREPIGSVTEIDSYLRLLFARLGSLHCPTCHRPVVASSATQVVEQLSVQSEGRRVLILFPIAAEQHQSATAFAVCKQQMIQDGFTRVLLVDKGKIARAELLTLADIEPAQLAVCEVLGVVDRAVLGKTSRERMTESIEAAFRAGGGRCVVCVEAVADSSSPPTIVVDGKAFQRGHFSEHPACESCGREFVPLQPELFNPRSAIGACPSCHGDGLTIDVDWSQLVPDASKSLAQDALALWAEPRWRHERRRLMDFADQNEIATDAAFKTLSAIQRDALLHGLPMSDFDGVVGFFKRQRRRAHQESAQSHLAQWCRIESCPACNGSGLNDAAQCVRLRGRSMEFARLRQQPISDVLAEFHVWQQQLDEADRQLVRHVMPEVFSRLQSLMEIGLGYLSLDRHLSTLSRGEAQRVALVSVLAAQLVNTLYVLDEPTAGLHPRDIEPVLAAVQRLRNIGNTVVVIEHDTTFLAAADHCIEIGPGAGQDGGRVVVAGSFEELRNCAAAPTAKALQVAHATTRTRRQPVFWLTLRNVRHLTLDISEVRFPLGCLCVVTGVSGSGKSLLVQETLYPALCQKLGRAVSARQLGRCEQLSGEERIDDVQLVDDAPLSGGQRSNPATWLKAFDEIRKLYADTAEAKQRGLTAAYFSFNNDHGGRCPKCAGTGSIQIDMQFLADVVMTCPECRGTRFRREALDVPWRGMSIADVLGMTATSAFTFFKGQPRLQKKFKSLKDVGLGYLALGQPLNTLSGGEAQRLKLALMLSRTGRVRSLILMNEPTIGLHPADIERLLACFSDLIDVGHSLIVIEHSEQVVRAADVILELGLGAGLAGGRLIANGLEPSTSRPFLEP